MLKVTYRLKLGQDEFELQAEVKDEKEFFEVMSFYSSLPKTAPSGANDLKLVFRTTTQGHKYYSLVSEKEKMEFKFGQNLENKGGGLFPKGWEKLYEGKDGAGENVGTAAPAFGTQQTAAPAAAATQVAPNVAAFGTQQMPQPQVIAAPAQVAQPTPVATPSAPTAPVTNPQVAQVANNVLARFGINK